jgi:hypothetical protein
MTPNLLLGQLHDLDLATKFLISLFVYLFHFVVIFFFFSILPSQMPEANPQNMSFLPCDHYFILSVVIFLAFWLQPDSKQTIWPSLHAKVDVKHYSLGQKMCATIRLMLQSFL